MSTNTLRSKMSNIFRDKIPNMFRKKIPIPTKVPEIIGKVQHKTYELYSNATVQYAFFIAGNLAFLAYMIYAYIEGSNGNPAYTPVYYFVNTFFSIHASVSERFHALRVFWANMSSDAFGDMIMTLIFVNMPVPFLPVGNRTEIFFMKFGLYNMITGLLVGNPSYTEALSKPVSSKTVIEHLLFLVVLVSLLFAGQFIRAAEK